MKIKIFYTCNKLSIHGQKQSERGPDSRKTDLSFLLKKAYLVLEKVQGKQDFVDASLLWSKSVAKHCFVGLCKPQTS